MHCCNLQQCHISVYVNYYQKSTRYGSTLTKLLLCRRHVTKWEFRFFRFHHTSTKFDPIAHISSLSFNSHSIAYRLQSPCQSNTILHEFQISSTIIISFMIMIVIEMINFNDYKNNNLITENNDNIMSFMVMIFFSCHK